MQTKSIPQQISSHTQTSLQNGYGMIKRNSGKKKRKRDNTIRRLYYTHLSSGERFFTHFSKVCESLENIQGYQNVQRPCLWDIQRSMSCYETFRKWQQVLWLYRWICILGISPILWSNKSMKIRAILSIKRKKA